MERKQAGASGRSGGVSLSTAANLLAVALLVFTIYVTVHTEMLKAETRRHLADSAQGQQGSELRSVHLAGSDLGGAVADEPGPWTLPDVDESLRSNGGGFPKTMAREPPELPVPEYLAFIGVFTSIAPQYLERRKVLRKSWFPPTKAALEEFESKNRLKMRFVVGKDKDGQVPQLVREEEEEFGGHLHLDVFEEYDNLKLKMLKYFRDTVSIYRAQYYLKVDDDIWFRPDRVPLAVHQWQGHNAGFVGCFRKGTTMFDKPNNRYFEPQRFLFHQEKYFLYTAGPTMGISYEAAALLGSVPQGGLRFYGAGDASVGGWMLGLNVSHHEDHRLCHMKCEYNTIGYYDNCNGMCKPLEALPKLTTEQCGAEPTIPNGHTDLPEAKTYPFDPSRERCARIYKDWLDQSECRKALQAT